MKNNLLILTQQKKQMFKKRKVPTENQENGDIPARKE